MKFVKIISIIGIFIILSSCAKGPFSSQYKSKIDKTRYSSDHHIDRLPKSDIPLVINERVIAWMEYFQGRGREHFTRYMERSGKYVPMMKKVLSSKDLPEDLIYLAMIESGFSDHAYSRAHAVGPWQFISSTGKLYGLTINHYVDERRDPIKSTDAAATFLSDLYNEFGDWYLAMAAYNAGPGRVRNAIKKSGTRDFWTIADSNKSYLRSETRDYIPKFIAAAIIAKVPKNFGFNDIKYHDSLDYEEGVVETQTDLKVVAKCAGVKAEEVVLLNPHLRQQVTPPGKSNYKVRLPRGSLETFNVKYAALPKSERIIIVYHKIQRGESISSIARKYGVSKSTLLLANNIPSRRRHQIRAGKTLVIPKGGYAKYASNNNTKTRTHITKSVKSSGSQSLVKYKIRPGDTLSQIADRHGVGLSKLAQWNNLSTKSILKVGKTLKLYKNVEPSKIDIHKIMPGETLWAISRKYGVSVDQIVALNNLESASSIRAGQKIKIRKGQTASVQAANISAPTRVNASNTVSDTKTVQLKRGETLGHVAEKYGVSVKDLMAWNNIKDPRRIRAGRNLKIFSFSTSANTITTFEEPTKATNGYYTYKLKPGETLGGVANRHEVRVKDLMVWNNIKNPRSVRAGQNLKLYSSSRKSVGTKTINVASTIKEPKKASEGHYMYKLKPGETLGGVANRHGVRVKDLMAWNNIKDPRRIRAGQMLKIEGSLTKSNVEEEQDVKVISIDEHANGETSVNQKKKGVPVRIAEDRIYLKYKVKTGDTLWDIARKHGVTISNIQEWNDLKDPSQVKPGVSLAIYKSIK